MFRTEVTVPQSAHKISLKQPVLCLGSCFAEVVGQGLAQNKFNTLINPFGVMYNPCSILKLLEYAVSGEVPAQDTYLENEGIYFNYDLHSNFSHRELTVLQETIAEAIARTASYLEKVEWMIFTFGTAYIYRRQDNHQLVANCHKMPDHVFQKELLDIAEILGSFQRFLQLLGKNRLSPKVILTVSPVRHIKTGLVENSLSKSILRLAAQQLMETNDQVAYFPAYEIMMDDLRDYRFYQKDLIHPNEVAQDYIWQKFVEAFFDPPAIKFTENWDKIRQALEHRPFHPESEKHQSFLRNTISLLDSLKDQVNVTEEIRSLQNQLL
ncbi:MAG: GSCFA domain-containing protein [Cyclobacteriaceae bacterium]